MAKRVSIAERQTAPKKAPPAPALLTHRSREGLVMVSPRDLEPNPFQPRRSFGEEKLKELAASIAQDGIIEPIVARQGTNGKYQIVAGERRWRAAQLAKLKQLPIVLNNCSDAEMEILALEENLHREDLNDVDRGRALKTLRDKLDLTWEQLGKRMGLSRRRVLMLAGLTDLPEEVQTEIEQGRLTEKHSRALSQLKDAKQQQHFLEAVQREQLSGDRAISAAKILQQDPSGNVERAVKAVAKPAKKEKGDPHGAQVRSAGSQLLGALSKVEPARLSPAERKTLATELASLIEAAQQLMKQLKA